MARRQSKILEVIAISVSDAMEAQAGGADRLEVVRNLEVGGLSPDLETVACILHAVSIPVRVMLRENPSMALRDANELRTLEEQARQFARLPIDGLVAGFLLNGMLDLKTLSRLAHCAPGKFITFHRAFDEIADPKVAIDELQTVPQVDRILTVGGMGDWKERRQRLQQWQAYAYQTDAQQPHTQPRIQILAGAGLEENVIRDLCADPVLTEIHIGRAARRPHEHGAPVCRHEVSRIKQLIEGSSV